MILIEWKTLAECARKHLKRPTLSVRTLKRWHYYRLKLPFAKTFPSKQGRVAIEKSVFIQWLNFIRLYPKKNAMSR